MLDCLVPLKNNGASYSYSTTILFDPDDGAVDRSQGVSDEADVEIADGRVN